LLTFLLQSIEFKKSTFNFYMETFLGMSPADWLIFLIAVGAHAPLVVGLVKQIDESQVFFTWLLYFLLDVILTISTSLKSENFSMVLGFSVGSFMMASILLYQGRFGWG